MNDRETTNTHHDSNRHSEQEAIIATSKTTTTVSSHDDVAATFSRESTNQLKDDGDPQQLSLLNISAIEPLSALNRFDDDDEELLLEEASNILILETATTTTTPSTTEKVDNHLPRHHHHEVIDENNCNINNINNNNNIEDLNLSAIEPIVDPEQQPPHPLQPPLDTNNDLNASFLNNESICVVVHSSHPFENVTLKKRRHTKRRAKAFNQGVDMSILDETLVMKTIMETSATTHQDKMNPKIGFSSSLSSSNNTCMKNDRPELLKEDLGETSPIKKKPITSVDTTSSSLHDHVGHGRKSSFGRSSALIEKDAPILERLYDSDDDDLKETIEKLSPVVESSSSPTWSSSPSSSPSSSDAVYSESSNESVCYPSFRNTTRTRAPSSSSRRIYKLRHKADSEEVFSSSSSSGQESTDTDTQKSSDDNEEAIKGFFSDFRFIIAELNDAKDNVLTTIKENGGKLVSMRADRPWYTTERLSITKFTSSKFVLITDELRMKPSYVVALLLDIPLLKKEWLIECAKQHQVIEDSHSIAKYMHKRGTYVAVGTGEKVEVPQNLNESFTIKPLQQRLFYDFVIKIISSDSKFTETWKKIFEAGGAKVEDEVSGLIGLQKNFVLVKEHQDVTQARLDFCNHHKIPIIDKDGVLQLIISGKVDSIQKIRIKQATQKTKSSLNTNTSFINTTNITQSLDDSIMLPCTPQYKKKKKKVVNVAAERAVKWFSNVQAENPCDVSIIDIRTPSSATTNAEFFKKKKGLFENAAAEAQPRATITHNTSFIAKKQPKLDKLDTSFSRSRLDMSILLASEDASPPEPAAPLTPGDYFLKEESLKLQKTRFVRLSKLACSKRKHDVTEDISKNQPWQMETFFIGDLVAVRSENIFENSTLKFMRIDKLHYKDNVTDGKEMQGTEYVLEEKSSKKLIPTCHSIKFSLSAICYKLAVANSEESESTTTSTENKKRKKSQRKEFFCDYAVKNQKIKQVTDPYMKELHILPNDQELLNELELKREKRSVKNSIRFKNPQYIRFSTFDFNGSTFEEGTFLRLFTRNAFLSSSNQPRHNGTVIRVKEIREGNIAQFVNTLNTAMIDGCQPCPIVRPSISSSLVVEVFKSVPEREKLYTFTHEVEEILFSQILTLEPLMAIQKGVFDPSFDVKALMNEIDVILIDE
ncbi:hypothetical protein FDP41_000354 [Naegleria fowleri]|uniref:BRCT domain-containing protein n=1 Tax=Naegleria fowleri TaxID=5763 RepID=A0A6A5CGQ2_NAEFO|nr:uncharacterized protein FDP41_000354 [Naegleria fowleri]KAF0984455.1 hypothetical protein FDP41_000354 [Naegleria fowleri]